MFETYLMRLVLHMFLVLLSPFFVLPALGMVHCACGDLLMLCLHRSVLTSLSLSRVLILVFA